MKRKQGWILYDQKQYEKNVWFADHLLECGESFSDPRLIITERLWYGVSNDKISFRYDGEEVEPPTYAVMRSIQPLLSQCLETAGTRVFNSAEAARICNDKRLTFMTLANTGIPMLPTRFYDAEFYSMEELLSTERPFVLKSVGGHGGAEVFLIETEENLKEALRAISGKPFLTQPLLTPYGRDVRIYVLGGKILAVILRTSESFRSNFSLGGSVREYELNEKERRMTEKVLSSFPAPLDLAGVDFLLSDDKMFFNEIEDVVGTRMLYQCTAIDPVKELMSYISSCLKG